MNKSLTPEDYELVLDNQHIVVPAVLKEKLISTTNHDIPIDVAKYEEEYCWIVHRQDAYAWNYKKDNGAAALQKNQFAQLRLPNSSLTYSSNLISIYEKDKANREASAIAISREGCVRYWHAYNKEHHVDTVLEIRHELIHNIHLVHLGSSESDTTFILVTTSGSIFSMSVHPDGKCNAIQICVPEGHGLVGRVSSFFFGSGPALSNHVNTSLIYMRDSEDAIDEHVLNPETLVITVGTTMLCAYEIVNRKAIWTIPIRALLGEAIGKYMAIKEGTRPSELNLIALDGQLFKEGILVAVAATHPMSENVTFFIVYLDKMDYDYPKIKYFQEIQSHETQKYFSPLNEGSYLNQVKLCIPEQTSKSLHQLKTDGVFFIHPNFIHSIFLPDGLSQKEDIVFIKTRMLRPNESIIGYGKDTAHVYVMCADSKTASLRIFPKGFEASPMDDVNIIDVVASLTRPSDNPEAEAIYTLFTEFCDKELGHSTCQNMPALKDLTKEEEFEIIMSYLWNVMDEMGFTPDYEQEFKEKKKFLDYFILFLKHSERFGTIFATFGQHGQTGQRVQGAEFFFEMYERLHIFNSLARIKYTDNNMADLLKHVAQNITEEYGFSEDGLYAALKFSTIHLIPQATVNLCRDLLAQPVFKDTDDRAEMLTKSTDLICEFANSLKTSRQAQPQQIPIERTGSIWTLRFLEAFSSMCLILVDQFTDEIYSSHELKKFLKYIQLLLPFHFEENPLKPDGHPILYRLYELGLDDAALELAHTYKDFNIICRILLERGDDSILESYKTTYEADNFEEYYYNYLYKKGLFKELLSQNSEKATNFINSCDNLRWRKDIQQENFDEAAKTLLMLADMPNNTIFKRQGYLTFAKMAMLSSEKPYTEELKQVNLAQEMLNFQDSLPEDFMRQYYQDNLEIPLAMPQLIELCKLRLEEEDCTPRDFFKALQFIVAVIKCHGETEEYVNVRETIWEAIIEANDWSRVKEEILKETAFAKVFEDLLKEETIDIPYFLPDCDVLLKKTAEIRKKCPASTGYIKYFVSGTRNDME